MVKSINKKNNKNILVGVSSTLSDWSFILAGSIQTGPQLLVEQQTKSLSHSPSGQDIVELRPQRASASIPQDSKLTWEEIFYYIDD